MIGVPEAPLPQLLQSFRSATYSPAPGPQVSSPGAGDSRVQLTEEACGWNKAGGACRGWGRGVSVALHLASSPRDPCGNHAAVQLNMTR